MIRTKHLALGVAACVPVLAVLSFFLAAESPMAPLPNPVLATPKDAYSVVVQEDSAIEERRSAFVASVQEALRKNPPMKAPEPESVIEEAEAVRVAVPEGMSSDNYGDAPALITQEEIAVPASVFESAPSAPTTSTSTQP